MSLTAAQLDQLIARHRDLCHRLGNGELRSDYGRSVWIANCKEWGLWGKWVRAVNTAVLKTQKYKGSRHYESKFDYERYSQFAGGNIC